MENNPTKLLPLQTSPVQVLSYNKSMFPLPRQPLGFHLKVYGLSLVPQVILMKYQGPCCLLFEKFKFQNFCQPCPQDFIYINDFEEGWPNLDSI